MLKTLRGWLGNQTQHTLVEAHRDLLYNSYKEQLHPTAYTLSGIMLAFQT
jgi:hypothetical protein